ncbi:hypothetical protein [Fluviicola sp.]|uniref:hypothetical protein n=1 Tax=Fluviicola sp. TaxID=1917219 RepID=UPI0031D22B45
MKQVILLTILSFSGLSQAQTAIIAHKSHSGTSATFVIDPSGNFGEPPPRLVQVIRLNDTASITVYDYYGLRYDFDTVYRDPYYSNYQLNIDSMNSNPYFKVEYINFKHSPDSLKPKIPVKVHIGEPAVKDQKVIQEQPAQENTSKKKKKSYLLFLFGITGGGMLLTKLFSRKNTSHPSIA